MCVTIHISRLLVVRRHTIVVLAKLRYYLSRFGIDCEHHLSKKRTSRRSVEGIGKGEAFTVKGRGGEGVFSYVLNVWLCTECVCVCFFLALVKTKHSIHN